jgi:hypothetical protein
MALRCRTRRATHDEKLSKSGVPRRSGSESDWDQLVTHLAVLLSHPSHDMEFALRVSEILDCLTLASLEEVCFHVFDEDVDSGTPGGP